MMGITLALPRLQPAPTDAEHLPILRSIVEGLRFVRGNSALMGSFAIDLVAMTFGMPRALFAVLALTVFDAGASGTGLLVRERVRRAPRSPRSRPAGSSTRAGWGGS